MSTSSASDSSNHTYFWFARPVDLDSTNPWNLPNWRELDEYDYDEPESWWRWQFLRRNPSYRRLWLRYQLDRPRWHAIRADGESRASLSERLFRIRLLMSPAFSVKDDPAIFIAHPSLCEVSPAFEDMSKFCQEAARRGQYLVAISPTAPLEKQFKIIAKEIEILNSEFYDDKSSMGTRQPIKKLAEYLRILDSVTLEPNLTWKQRAEVLDPRDYRRSGKLMGEIHKRALRATKRFPFSD